MGEVRTLEVRLGEYRDAMAFMAPQLQDLIDRLPAGSDVTPLQDGIKFYTEVAGDLTKLLNGEELRRFVVEGDLPDGSEPR